MRICVLGDSHTAALKTGWDRIKSEYPGYELVFFASRGQNLRHLRIKKNHLFANQAFVEQDIMRSSGGLKTIEPDKYDLFLIYALKARACFVDQNMFLSAALKQAVVNDLVSNTASSIIFSRLRKVTDKYTYFGHTPLLAESEPQNSNYPQQYVDGISLLNKAFYLSRNAKLCSQPIETVVNGHSTKALYSFGSKRLKVTNTNAEELHPGNDNEHMNGDFGQLWMQNFLQQVKRDSKRDVI